MTPTVKGNRLRSCSDHVPVASGAASASAPMDMSPAPTAIRDKRSCQPTAKSAPTSRSFSDPQIDCRIADILATPGSAMALRDLTAHLVFLLLALVLAAAPNVRAEDAPKPDTLLDRLELKIELSRHARLIAAQSAQSAVLAPFVSDGCSGGMSAVWRLATSTVPALVERHGEHPPWERCCTAHDERYHAGAPPGGDARTSFEARRHADENLRQCVRQIGEERADTLSTEYGLEPDEVALLYAGIADVIYRAVRLGGAPCTGLPWRWGFGWPDCQ